MSYENVLNSPFVIYSETSEWMPCVLLTWNELNVENNWKSFVKNVLTSSSSDQFVFAGIKIAKIAKYVKKNSVGP